MKNILFVIFLISFLGFSQNKPDTGSKKTLMPDKDEQQIFCQEFHDTGFSGLIAKVEEFGHNLYDVYNCIECDKVTKADLIKHRASVSTAQSDIMSLARYYIKINNDPETLTFIFNRIIDNPGKPRGTLLDWVDYYSSNPNLSEIDKGNFARYESTIRRFGGKREAEFTAEERQKYSTTKCN
ncbi:hypothetical protein [Aquaticitalea lipolytica]|uniref:hypothetical protein n=1 Tax=Aquaticitalea lipolytica TaxID=1247562 RepID=UPI0024B908AC|nr:hypothetical protein [Aquaticitalea lipolytica]